MLNVSSFRVRRALTLAGILATLIVARSALNFTYRTWHKRASQSRSADDTLWAHRADSVRDAFVHAYAGYMLHAPFPADELLPVSNGSVANFNGWGLTVVDGLDTMLLLGLHSQFYSALSQVETLDFAMPHHLHAPFFETVIRYLGGLLSAYAISNEPALLDRADELGQKLLPAFHTTSGLPVFGINTQTRELLPSSGNTMLFAEIASCQMEFKYLAYLTGRQEYFNKVEKVMDHMKASQPAHGMWPTVFDTNTGAPANTHHSIGAWADSAYEYLLKQYLLSGKSEHRLAHMYMNAMSGIIENLLFISHSRHLLYITDTNSLLFAPTRKLEHLSCFFPGLLALGASTLPSAIMSEEKRELHMWAAEGLAHTCWMMYEDQQSGLAPEAVVFDGGSHGEGFPGYPTSNFWDEKWMTHVRRWEQEGRPGWKPPGVGSAAPPIKDGEAMDYKIADGRYMLRPETLESMFIMYRTTGDPKWRERGWAIWEAIEQQTRVPAGYASVIDVEQLVPEHADSMPSYFLAETVKYAYLLTLDRESDPWPEHAWQFNTEAHPLPVFKWSEWQRMRYGV